MRTRLLLALALAALAAGCTGASVGTSNFELRPQKVGWYTGEEAHFVLSMTPSLLRSEPSFTIDRRFAIEEIRLTEKGMSVGGDYKTKEPDDVSLRLSRENVTADEFVLDATNGTLDLRLVLPEDLRDSEYVLELRLFQVGWVKSEPFRVDRRASAE